METPFSPLSFGKSFMKFHTVVPENLCRTFMHHLLGRPLIAKIPNFSIVSFIGVYGSKFTKFSTLVEHHGDCLPWKFDWGLQQKILRESAKTWNFCTCTCKSAHCVYLRGSKVKVEHTPCRPLSYGSTAVLSVQEFASVPVYARFCFLCSTYRLICNCITLCWKSVCPLHTHTHTYWAWAEERFYSRGGQGPAITQKI